ncbi:MAG: MFS transporter, partial [Bacteroidota bacterium]
LQHHHGSEKSKDGPGFVTIFAFFAAMMVLQLLFVIFLMPETKGKSLEELDELLGHRKNTQAEIKG